MLQSFDRPVWLYRLHGVAPTGEGYFRSPPPVTEHDHALCQRLIDAYRLAHAEAPPPEGMWGHDLFRSRHRRLVEALGESGPEPLAQLLSSVLRSDVVLGMAQGSMSRIRRSGPLARLSWLSSMRRIVAIAEALGTTRAENPEQGPVGGALRGGVDELVAGIERRLGLSLEFPDVGAAYGDIVGGRFITPDTPDQLYAAARLCDVIAAYLAPSDAAPRIVEIGGGYGGMAYWLLSMIDARYVLVDLPIVCVLQGYFLSQALGHEAVALHGEPPADVTIVPSHALASVQTPFDVLVNKDSLPEIALEAACEYVEWAREGCSGVFYSNNQESGGVFEGFEQNVVCELVERIGGFERVRRDPSWVRRGYVEEVYLPAAGSPRS